MGLFSAGRGARGINLSIPIRWHSGEDMPDWKNVPSFSLGRPRLKDVPRLMRRGWASVPVVLALLLAAAAALMATALLVH